MNKEIKEHNNKETKQEFLFGKRNYTIMLIGLAVIALGFILMLGFGVYQVATNFRNSMVGIIGFVVIMIIFFASSGAPDSMAEIPVKKMCSVL